MPADRSALLKSMKIDLDDDLLTLALTHRSYAYEQGGIPTNERLEFLGDAILGATIANLLYRTYPAANEGELSRRRASVVSTVALADVARKHGLGEYLLLGIGEERTGGRDKSSLLADAMEALFGATFLAHGSARAAEVIIDLLEPLLEDDDSRQEWGDPKTLLQEHIARESLGQLKYFVTGTGPDHDRTFTAKVSVGDRMLGEGVASSKKHAEMLAAIKALAALGVDSHTVEPNIR